MNNGVIPQLSPQRHIGLGGGLFTPAKSGIQWRILFVLKCEEGTGRPRNQSHTLLLLSGYRKNLFVLTTILGCIYLFIRLFVLQIYPPLNYGEIKIFEVFIIILRSLVEFIIPVDSGVLMNLTGEYGVWIIILFFVYLFVFVLFLAGNIKSAKEKRKMVLILLMIPVFTFAFYYFRGGLSFRFYSSTFAFWLIGLAVFSVWNKRTSIFTVACKNICISFILIVFIFGSYNVVSAWSKSFIESREFFNQFVNLNTEKEIVLLNYPHSLNNSYCFSDIDYAFGFYKTGSFRKYPCFIQGAATSMYSPSDYDNIMVECRQLCDTVFVLSSNSPNCYFLPFPFYNESIYINDTIEISKNVSFIPQNSVVVSTWFQKTKTNSIKLLIRKSYKERIYLYYSEGKLIEFK